MQAQVKIYITVLQVEITIFVEIQLNYNFLCDPDIQITGFSSKMNVLMKIAKFAISKFGV